MIKDLVNSYQPRRFANSLVSSHETMLENKTLRLTATYARKTRAWPTEGKPGTFRMKIFLNVLIGTLRQRISISRTIFIPSYSNRPFEGLRAGTKALVNETSPCIILVMTPILIS
jgi:hypothetical protein